MNILLVSAHFAHQPLELRNTKELSRYNVRFLQFNDKNFPARSASMHPRLKSKIPKMLAWEYEQDFDYIIWLDSKFSMNEGALSRLLEPLGEKDLYLFRHPYRSSVQEEINYMLTLMREGDSYLLERYLGEDMQRQVQEYLSDGFQDTALFACGCFIYSKRLVANRLSNLMKEWFYHNARYSVQDQLSLPYLLQKFNTEYHVYDFDLFNCAEFEHRNIDSTMGDSTMGDSTVGTHSGRTLTLVAKRGREILKRLANS